MLILPAYHRGLGQLEAYLRADEGVAFQMDNNMYWDLQSIGSLWVIQGVVEKTWTSKFWVNQLPSGKVVLRNDGGMYLAQLESRTEPKTYPVQLVPYSESPDLTFDVFYRGHRVAFQSCHGYFLERVSRRHITKLEATTFFPEEHCFFCPLIGDLEPPTFSLLRLIPRNFRDVNAVPCLVDCQVYVNMTEETKRHTFTMTWEAQTIDRTFWPRLWGLGIHSAFSFSVGNSKPILLYSQDNEHRPCVQRDISETQTKEVDVPRKSEALASFFVDCYDPTVLPFIAFIRKVKPGGDAVILREPGSWSGLFYDNFRVNVEFRSLPESCPAT